MKRILSLIIVLCILPFSQISVFAEETEELKSYQKEAYTAMDALGFLSSLYTEESLADDTDGISRAEFAELVYNVFCPEKYSSDELYFHDVPRLHYASEKISALVEKGIISGDDNKMFYPERVITTTEAATMITNALGYKLLTGQYDWPAGVTKVANDLELYKSVDGQDGLSAIDAIVMLYNSLYAEMAQINYNGVSMNDNGETFLNAYLDIYSGRGLLTAYDRTSVYGDGVADGAAKIGDKYFNSSTVDVYEQLGKDVKYFYRDDGYACTLLWVRETGRSEELVLDYIKDEVSFDAANNRFLYANNNNNKTRYANLADNVSVVYNSEYLASDLVGKMSGVWHKAKLISTTDNGKYDVVILEAYENYIVNYKDSVEESLILKSCDKSLSQTTYTTVDLDDYDRVIIELPGGAQGSIVDLTKETLVSVQMATDTIKFFVSDSVVEGTVKSISTNGGYQIMEMNDTEYYSYRKNCNFDVSLSGEVKLLLDKFGYVAAIGNKFGDVKFGCIIRAYTDGGLDDTVYLRMYTSEGEKVALPLYKKVRIDGDRPADETAACNILNNSAAELVAYTENKDGQITKIYTAINDEEPTSGAPLVKAATASSKQYNAYSHLIGPKIHIGPDTILIGVPSDVTNETDSSFFSIGDRDNLREKSYDAEAYFYGERKEYADIVVIKNNQDMGLVFTSPNWTLITDFAEVWDEEEGEVLTEISGYCGNVYTSFRFRENPGYEKGDIVDIRDSLNGIVPAHRHWMRWDMSEQHFNGYLSRDYMANGERYVVGYVHDVIGNSVLIGYDSGADFDEIISPTVPLMIYDTEVGEARQSSVAELKTYQSSGNSCSKVFLFYGNYVMRNFITYN